jgi:uncharacterized protein YhfF
MASALGSVLAMWSSYLAFIGQRAESTELTFRFWPFCDNERDADELAKLVAAGIKRASAPCLWELEDGRVPVRNDLDIVTYWSGEACCAIRTEDVEIKAFADVSPDFAAREGEGDRSLEYWRRVHWAYYERVLKPLGRAPTGDMPIVCQRFEVVYPANAAVEQTRER